MFEDISSVSYLEIVGQLNNANLGDYLYSYYADEPIDEPIAQKTPREELGIALEAAASRNQVNYTPLTWARFQSPLVFARSVYNNATAVEAQIIEAIERLTAAQDSLVRR
ncbi:MAG: hypothetical protein FWC69_05555 [Defluviitaleaceae bacterium]|nr:hypothetical protein [Defluviitaleaceae bacterium]